MVVNYKRFSGSACAQSMARAVPRFFRVPGRQISYRWGGWGLCESEGRKEVEQYLRREFEARHSNIGSLLGRFFPAEKVHPTEDPRVQDPVGTIRQIYFPPEELAKLTERYGDSSYSSEDEARAVREFKEQMTGRGVKDKALCLAQFLKKVEGLCEYNARIMNNIQFQLLLARFCNTIPQEC